jgi:tetratricopeptide (TPR) repeat protein
MSWLRRVFGDEKVASTAPGVRSIRFDSAGWKEQQASNEAAEWRNADGDVLRARLAAGPAPYLSSPTDIGALREHYRREAAAAEGAIVSVETVSVQGIPCVEVIKKFERRPAYAYEGVLAFGFDAYHYVLTVESIERGTTGVRDAVVTGHLVERGELEISEDPGPDGASVRGWFLDPYLEVYDGPVLHSLSDDERLDVLFPEHPLSKIRSVLGRIMKTLRFDPSLRSGMPPRSGAAAIPTPGIERSRTDRARRPLKAATVGTLFVRAGRNKAAMGFLEEAVQEAESAPDGPGSGLAEAAMELGHLHVILSEGDPGKAQALLRRAAGLFEQSGRNRDLAGALMLLGLAGERLGDFGEAEAALRKARAAVGQSAPEDLLRGSVTVNLGRICISQHKADEAEPLFTEALSVFEKEDPSQSSNAAVALNGLGLVHNERGRYSAAIPLFEKALSIFQAVHGADFPDVATVLRNMAFSWHQMGNEEKARELLDRAARVGQH